MEGEELAAWRARRVEACDAVRQVLAEYIDVLKPPADEVEPDHVRFLDGMVIDHFIVMFTMTDEEGDPWPGKLHDRNLPAFMWKGLANEIIEKIG